MIKAGIEVPDLAPGIVRWEAHHIVPAGDKSAIANRLRRILSEANIDINSAANGVFLPKSPGRNTIDIIEEKTMVTWTVSTHNGRHAMHYYEYIEARLNGTDPDDILHELHEIRRLLLSGQLELGKPK